jgi:hypothetical protein
MKANLFRLGVTLSTFVMLLETLGAPRKWGR